MSAPNQKLGPRNFSPFPRFPPLLTEVAHLSSYLFQRTVRVFVIAGQHGPSVPGMLDYYLQTDTFFVQASFGNPTQIFGDDVIEEKGENARLSAFVGAIAVGDLVKSTLGPKGMDKILQSAYVEGFLSDHRGEKHILT
jgi:hypothetical protein